MIGITGADGFIGMHLRAAIQAQGGSFCLANRKTFSTPADLREFAKKCRVIIHLAGVNRDADSARLKATNIQLATDLAKACAAAQRPPAIIFASSRHVDLDTVYGEAKKQCGEIFLKNANATGAAFVNVILPHVFGEYAKPFYNSAVATFCHQAANGESSRVDKDMELNLIHAQDVAALLLRLAQSPRTSELRPEGLRLQVSAALDQIRSLHTFYADQQLPDLSAGFTRDLFNTYRSYLNPQATPMTLRSDQRGSLFEAIKGGGSGQMFCSSTRAGFVRGNHFHLRKVERFVVLRGEAVIKLRRLYADTVSVIRVSGAAPAFVDIPTLCTHSIENVGSDELLTLFWANEIFDVGRPDTYAEAV